MSSKSQLLSKASKVTQTMRKQPELVISKRCSFEASVQSVPLNDRISAGVIQQRLEDQHDVNKSRSLSSKTLKDVPGPRSLPIIGTLWQYLPGGPLHGKSWYDKTCVQQHRFGDIVREEIRPGYVILHLFNPEHFHVMYNHEGKHPTRESFRMLRHYNKKYNNRVNGLLTSGGETWSNQRKAMQAKMSKLNIVRTYAARQNEVGQDFMHFIRHLRNGKTDIIEDLTPHLYKFASESVAVVCFNKRLDILNIDNKADFPANKFIACVQDVLSATQTELKSLPLYLLYNTREFQKLVNAQDYIKRLTASYVQEAVSRNHRSELNNEIIPHLINNTSLSHKQIYSLIAEFFFGGVDTTSHLIAFILYNLCTNPLSMVLLRQEVDNVVGSAQEVTPSHLDKLTYLKAVIKETLRMTPVSPGNIRTLETDATISGYNVPAKTDVVTHNEWAGHQERFVPQADRFLPERWIRNGDHLPINPFIVLGFGFGPRSCPGRRLAEQETSICIVKLMQNFDIEYCLSEPMQYDMKIVNTPTTPLTLKFKDRIH